MGWTRNKSRVARDRRRPSVENLEVRQLLSGTSSIVSNLNPDGSTNFDQIIGASATRSEFNVDGTGQTVAVIDTGVDYNDVALGAGLGAGHKVVAGVDFTGSPNGVLPTWYHGTSVAGLIAGNSSSYSGVAPGADIVALRVFGDNNQGSFGEIAQALDWVIQNHSAYNITAVNLSVTDGGNYTSNEFANDGGVGQEITQAVDQLDAMNIPVVMAAGNSFDGKTQGIGFPAIVPDVISVTSTDANDKLASDAQRLGTAQGGASAVKIAAPGVGITGLGANNSTSAQDGTSFATPLVTGSIVLLQEMYEKAFNTLPTVAQLQQWLQQGAVPVHDSVTGVNVGRLDVLNSAQILEQQIQQIQAAANPAPTTPAPAPTTPTAPPSTVTNTTATPPSTTNTSTTSTTSTSTTSTTSAVPMTQVILNGVAVGSFSTTMLAAEFPHLFAFLGSTVTTLRIWAPPGSTVQFGPTVATAASSSKAPVVKTPLNHSATKAEKLEVTTVNKKGKAVVKHSTSSKGTIESILSYLFPFKL
jgi:type VI secretion system secreted protein VgrG